MPKTARDVPPPLELACLKALWTLGEGNVRSVQQSLAHSRPLAYTTVMTVLDRLVRKGKLTRRKVGRSFVYSPTATRDTLRKAAVRELLEGFFDGSPEQLLVFLRTEEAKPALATVAEAEGQIDPVLL
ncbi:MAG TPA: BlaI/MecI/CopY family transcriptional regulator [Candidatus Acidoferrales bacterium]|nr:BlaI/MecI/CopY family transcriptional regulator [Candidatus Acidoferrales bacterium]